MLSRFIRNLNGDFGEYWKRDAQKELDKVKSEIESGEITIDSYGVARNCIGRVVMDDLAEKVSLITDSINLTNTAVARDEEDIRFLKQYKENHTFDSESLVEMRSVFGEGTQVVDIITGESITL